MREELCCLSEWFVLQGRVIIVLTRVLQRDVLVFPVLMYVKCVGEEER